MKVKDETRDYAFSYALSKYFVFDLKALKDHVIRVNNRKTSTKYSSPCLTNIIMLDKADYAQNNISRHVR